MNKETIIIELNGQDLTIADIQQKQREYAEDQKRIQEDWEEDDGPQTFKCRRCGNPTSLVCKVYEFSEKAFYTQTRTIDTSTGKEIDFKETAGKSYNTEEDDNEYDEHFCMECLKKKKLL